MADIKWKLSTRAVNPLVILSTELNSLALNSGVLSAAVQNNGADLDLYLDLELLVAFPVAPAADAIVEVWIARMIDGVNTEDASGGASPFAPRNGQQSAFVCRNVTSTQRMISPRIVLPPGDFRILLINRAQAFAGSGNTLTGLFYREQVN